MSTALANGVAKGDVLAPLTVRLTRADLVRYAGASGDFNPIHWSDRIAAVAGLPGVIAHGMLTLGIAGTYVSRWAGDPGAVRSLGARFTRPVVVPDDDEGAAVEVTGVVSDVSDAVEGDARRVAKVDISVRFEGRPVLGRAVAEVLLPA